MLPRDQKVDLGLCADEDIADFVHSYARVFNDVMPEILTNRRDAQALESSMTALRSVLVEKRGLCAEDDGQRPPPSKNRPS